MKNHFHSENPSSRLTST